jgi:uncharacterized linocin/CFP29 family protein
MTNLGREKLWAPEVWAEIDKAVMTEVGRLRVAQKVFTAMQTPNAPNVSADILVQPGQAGGQAGPQPATLMIQEGATQPFMEMSVEFALTQSQVDNEATLHTAQTLARLAARSLALAEDTLFFQGAQAVLPPGVRVTNVASAGPGLLNLPGVGVIQVPRQQGGGFAELTFTAVSQGIGQLTGRGHPGPYTLILEPAIFADTHAPAPNTLTTTADRITPLVDGRMYQTGSMPLDRGLLTSVGGDPTTIYVAQDAITAYTQEDQQGNYRFRVFERVQIVPREAAAFVRLEFAPAGQAHQGARGQHRP